jgi:hypothetical protein
MEDILLSMKEKHTKGSKEFNRMIRKYMFGYD